MRNLTPLLGHGGWGLGWGVGGHEPGAWDHICTCFSHIYQSAQQSTLTWLQQNPTSCNENPGAMKILGLSYWGCKCFIFHLQHPFGIHPLTIVWYALPEFLAVFRCRPLQLNTRSPHSLTPADYCPSLPQVRILLASHGSP